MSTDYKFQGWLCKDKTATKGGMQWGEYEPPKWNEDYVDIKITHCGICGSDLHTASSGWGPAMYPCVVGHEIVGEAVKVGSKVEGGIKVGDRVGVGAQSASCLKPDCEECSAGEENHCQNPEQANTYSDKFADGSKTQGGYADYWRGPSHFVFKIPDAIASDVAAPMLCGGITTFSPLYQNGAGPGKKVGIVGIGGLGHFGIMSAKALGCSKIVAISRTASKKEDAMKMGATDFIATDDDPDWATHHAGSLDLIVCTVSSPKMPLMQYLQLLGVKGKFVQVGAPEDPMPAFPAFSLIAKAVTIGGSMIGSPKEIRHMLDVFAEKGIKTWNVNVPMKEANQAVIDMGDGKARYRYVLVNEKHQSQTKL